MAEPVGPLVLTPIQAEFLQGTPKAVALESVGAAVGAGRTGSGVAGKRAVGAGGAARRVAAALFKPRGRGVAAYDRRGRQQQNF